MRKLLIALTTTSLAFAAACTGTSTTSNPSGSTSVTVAPLPSATSTSNARTSPSLSPLPSASGSGSTTGGTTSNKACSLVSTADAQKVVGNDTMSPTEKTGTLPGTPAQGDLCVYEGATGNMTIGVLTNTPAADFTVLAKAVPNVQQVQGIGDQAFVAKGTGSGSAGATVLVLKGDTYLSLSATSSSQTSDELATALQELAKTAVDSL